MIYTKYILCFYILITCILAGNSQQQKSQNGSSIERTNIFYESFDNNSNNWITENSWINAKISNGVFTIKCNNYRNQTGLTYKTFKIDQNKDYELETSLRIIKGTGGFVFGQNEIFDHYRIELGNKDDLLILKDIPSDRIPILRIHSISVKSCYRPEEFNKLTIRKIRDNFYFFVNDSLCCQDKNIKPYGEQIGFNVGLNSEILIDYLNISYLSDKITPILAEKTPDKVLFPSSDPQIEWMSPSKLKTSLEAYSANVRLLIKSKKGIKSVLFYVNGIAVKGEPEIKVMPGDSGFFQVEKVIYFEPGENNVYLIATNGAEESRKSDLRYFSIPSATLPEITWLNPSSASVLVNKDELQIEVCFKSQTNLKSIQVLVNGNPQSESTLFQTSLTGKCNYTWKGSVVLKEGDNEIFVIATNLAGSIPSEKRVIRKQLSLAENRLALVFGNSKYGSKIDLKNPVNDANLMEATLERLGFYVIKRTNATKTEMEKALTEFNQKLNLNNVALFYYAGHGIQVDGTNYLIPVDAKLEEKVDCQWEAISVTNIVGQFEKYPDNINIVILDACRNNPFRNWVRGEEAGFKFLPNVSGTIIGYATVEGATASDGSGNNGLYTEELVKQIVIPQPIESVFKKTRVQVELRSGGTQSPRETTGLRNDFYFVKPSNE
jgi:hypothetical protein